MIDKPLRLENMVQQYAWGSKTAIQELLGRQTDGRTPWAELWMGAHPKAPSRVVTNGDSIPLDTLIARHPGEILGNTVAGTFGGTFPFLFKVLAADQPLSIQAHPPRHLAEEGFERENGLQIPIDAPHRNYRDRWPKPEIICAVKPFYALNGFRGASEIKDLFMTFCPDGLSGAVDILSNDITSGHDEESAIRSMFEWILQMPAEKKSEAIRETTERASGMESEESRWIMHLFEYYPEDIGVLSPLFLNLIRLEPFTAMFLTPGSLHAYLEGVGIELMANSDNVLRGGLTSKHMDVEELVRVVNFSPTPLEILRPVARSACEQVFQTNADEFELCVIRVDEGHPCSLPMPEGPEILLCMEGSARIFCGPEDSFSGLEQGQSLLIPAGSGPYTIKGNATFFRASIPRATRR